VLLLERFLCVFWLKDQTVLNESRLEHTKLKAKITEYNMG